MRIARYLIRGTPVTGILEEETLRPLAADSPEAPPAGRPLRLEEAVMLPPCRPGKIVGVGLNYREHARERGKPVPAEPLLFLKAPSAALAHGRPIRIPEGVGRVDQEAELAIVIGRRAKALSVAEASRAILGYTCFNDVTARELQDRDVQFARAKSFDTFAPFGPWIDTDVDPADLEITGVVSGVIRQSSRTRDMIFPPAFLVAYVSRVMTLEPGDLIATGTPSGIGPLVEGDTAEVTVEGIGTLTNPVVADAP
jgi:2-keto-4-pentenoate hydratase/2-oxohepta-3-ene-1,7-dioic acid hydratase in catechol pathway